MSTERMTPWRRMMLLCTAILLACTVSGACAADFAVSLQEEEWSWVPGEVATFSGNVTGDAQELDRMTLQISLLPEPAGEDNGSAVFTSVNDKKIKVRKQSDTLSLEGAGESGSVSFTGSWFIPEDSAFSRADLTATLTNGDGQAVTSFTLHCGADGAETQSSLLRIPVDIGTVQLILAAAAAVIWAAAAIRILICRRRAQERCTGA